MSIIRLEGDMLLLNKKIAELESKDPNNKELVDLRKQQAELQAKIQKEFQGTFNPKTGLEVETSKKEPKAEPYSPEENQKAARKAGESCPKDTSGLPDANCVKQEMLPILQRNREIEKIKSQSAGDEGLRDEFGKLIKNAPPTKAEEPPPEFDKDIAKDFNESFDSCKAENPDSSAKMLDCLGEKTLIKHLTRHPEDAGTFREDLGKYIKNNDDANSYSDAVKQAEKDCDNVFSKKPEKKETCVDQLVPVFLGENQEAEKAKPKFGLGESSQHQTGSAVDADEPPVTLTPTERKMLEAEWKSVGRSEAQEAEKAKPKFGLGTPTKSAKPSKAETFKPLNTLPKTELELIDDAEKKEAEKHKPTFKLE